MKRSLFSLVAGCVAALVVNSFTAHPVLGIALKTLADNRPAADQARRCAASPASGACWPLPVNERVTFAMHRPRIAMANQDLPKERRSE